MASDPEMQARVPQPADAQEQPVQSRASALFSPATIDRWWVRAPVRLDRYSPMLSVAWSDGMYLTAWPRVAMLLPSLALIFGLVEGATHWSLLTIGQAQVSASEPVVAFAQILPLVIIAVMVGSLSANAGLMLVLGYALGDFLWVGPQLRVYGTPLHIFFFLRVPLLLSYVLFFMLTVIPVVSTNYLLAGLYRRRPGRDLAAKVVRIGAMALVQGLFVHEWIFVAPVVMRVIWSWAGDPIPVGIQYFHRVTSPWLELAAVTAVILRGWLTSRAESRTGVTSRMRSLDAALETADQSPAFSQRSPRLHALLSAGLMTLLISGFINRLWLGAVIMGMVTAILLARVYLLPGLSVWIRWTAFITRVPEGVRLAAAVVATYLITVSGFDVLPGQSPAQNSVPGQFGPELVSLGIGLLLMIALLPSAAAATIPDRRRESHETAEAGQPGMVWAAARGVLVVTFLMLFAARKAYAACADPACCCSGSSILCSLASSGFLPFLFSFFGDGTGDNPNQSPPEGDNPPDKGC
jgi:hypothetical protein